MNIYELLYIVPPPYTEKDLPNIQKNIDKIIEESGAAITHEENWGNRKLAYPIKQAQRGFYILVYFRNEPENLKKIESKFKLIPEILRYQIVKIKQPLIKIEKAPAEKPVGKKKITEPIDLVTLDEKIDKLLEI